MKLGLIINPLAGIGGAVALKGSDGADIVRQALQRGARPRAGERVSAAFGPLLSRLSGPILTASGDMGESIVDELGLEPQVLYQSSSKRTTAQDTERAVQALCAAGVDLLLFAGGDGTARDVLNALKALGKDENLPAIGIPAGCKIHSAVYAVTPVQAGEMAAAIINGQPMSLMMKEVMDLDESEFRAGRVKASCYGYLLVPVDDTRMQVIKQGGIDHEAVVLQDIAADIVDNMEDDCLYLIGSGSTTAAIMENLGLPNTLLGVDVIKNNKLVASDVGEQEILSLIEGRKARIIVTTIGGQGHIFGRGNQQFSPEVLTKVGLENIIIIATNEKLRSLNGRPLLVDTGDATLDTQLSGTTQIITGYEQKTLYNIA